MASRKPAASEKTALEEKDSQTPTPGSNDSETSKIAPAVPAAVIAKLLAFTLAMIAGPIGTYYLTLKTVYKGNSTFAGATAAIMANLVLVAYVVVAMKEDQSDRLEAAKEKKKL